MSVSYAIPSAALAVLVFWNGQCYRSTAPVGARIGSVVAAASVDGLFAEAEDTPLPAELTPHELVVRHALPVVAEQTWRLDQANLAPEEQARALAIRARARADLRQFELARADLDTALELAPEAADVRRQRAWLYGTLDRLADAQADLDLAFRAEPHSTATARVLGLLRFEQGRFADAVAALSFRLEDEPVEPPLTVLYAIARLRSGATTDPRLWAVVADGARALAPWPQAIASFMAGRLARADLLAFARGDTVDPSPVRACQAWFYLGQRALLEGDADRAARDWRQAVRTGGTSAVEYRFALAELARLKM